MNSLQAQQSFSSYSQEGNNEPHPSEDDKFSEYEEHIQNKLDDKDKVREAKTRPGQKRRYSYGKIEQKSGTYNYLNPRNELNSFKPPFFTSNLNNLKQCKYIKGAGSPCGIGAFESSALEEYEKCYLSGLSKYYKSHNYINKKETRALSTVSSSVDQSKNLDRSQYWNGQKFQYLIEKEMENNPKHKNEIKQNFQIKEKKNTDSNISYERSLTSGLIVNKKEIKENKATDSLTMKPNKNSNNYIRIQEDFSNSKNCSQVKKPLKSFNPIFADNISQALVESSLKQNVEVVSKTKENDFLFQSIQVRPQDKKLMEKDFSAVFAQKNELAKQNMRLRQILVQRNIEIQRIANQRIKQNEDYTEKIRTLKVLFENQRKSLLKEHEEEINIYKSVRKEAIKSELVKEEEERLNLIIQKSKIENELKRVTQELLSVKQQLISKNTKLSIFERKSALQKTQENTENQRMNNQPSKSKQKQPNLPLKDNSKKGSQFNQKNHQVPEWMSNFIGVFKNMVRKLVGEVNHKWSQKKLVIIGWKVVKLIIQKAVKLGIKVPSVVNQNQMGDCSIISYPCKNSDEPKKYNLAVSKKPIRN